MIRHFGLICLLALVAVIAAQNLRISLDRQLCARQQQRCNRASAQLAAKDETLITFNQQCRVIRGPSWRNVTRCQLAKATCELTIIKCRRLTCRNVEKVLR